MWGSDYPFVEQHCKYTECTNVLQQWRDNGGVLDFMLTEDWLNIMHTTSEQLFGFWESQQDPVEITLGLETAVDLHA
jgi:hypothetical protein